MTPTQIHSEKLYLIQLLAQTNDVSIIQKVKDALTSSVEKLTEQELINRVKESELSIENGNVCSIEELKREAEQW